MAIPETFEPFPSPPLKIQHVKPIKISSVAVIDGAWPSFKIPTGEGKGKGKETR